MDTSYFRLTNLQLGRGDAAEARPFRWDALPAPLAFDHAEIVGMAVKRLRVKLDYAPIGFQLLPDTFTLLELQRVHAQGGGQGRTGGATGDQLHQLPRDGFQPWGGAV